MRRHTKASRLELGPDSEATTVFHGPKHEPGAPLDRISVLVVDDSPSELERLSAWLALLGAEVTCARTCAGARQAVGSMSFHVLVLDRLLPDGDPFDLLRAHARPCGIVVASGFIDADTWSLIERRGAVPAPKSQLHSPLLLLGFIEEALRRADVNIEPRPNPTAPQREPDQSKIEPKGAPQIENDRWVVYRGPVTVDVRRRCVTVLGQERRLQPKQFDVLLHLMLKAEEIVSEAELLETVWADTTHGQSASIVRSTISRLRSGLGLPGDSFVQTAPGGWGVGIWPLLGEGARHKQATDE